MMTESYMMTESNTSNLASNNVKYLFFAINIEKKAFGINWAFICLSVSGSKEVYVYCPEELG